MLINLIGICRPRCAERLFPALGLCPIGDAETGIAGGAGYSTCLLNARPAADHGRLRNAARLCAPARYRRIGTPGELACWAVCSEGFCGPGLLCSVRGHDPVPPVTRYLCRYCRQPSALGKAPVSCPLCGAPLDVRPAVSGSGWMRQPMIPSMTRLSCGTIRCQINGTYVPVAEFELAASDWIYFSPKVLLWTDPATTLRVPQPSRGRSPGMMEAHGPGRIGVAENRAGEVIAQPLRRAQPVCVRPGRFLCATGNVTYRWRLSAVSYSTMAAEREYPAGRYLLNLTAAGRQGLVLLHASGDAFIRDLPDSQSILVSPASLLYWEDTVDLSLHLEFPYVPGQHARRVFWRSSRIWLRVCGPGRVAIDSACGQAEDARTADVQSFASWQRWDAPAATTPRAE